MRTSVQGNSSTPKIALLAGATGLVVREILHLLSRDPTISEVRALVRRSLPEQDTGPQARECISNFEELQKHPDWFTTDLVFCALGYVSVTIARSSLLLGNRHEHRFGEELAKRIFWMFPVPWRGVQASQVASALVHAAHEEKPGVRILDNNGLRKQRVSE